MKMLTYPERGLPGPLRAQVRALQDEAWPGADPQDPDWHDPAAHARSMVLVDADERVLAALDVLAKDLVHAGRSWAARGLSRVVTARAAQRRGYGRELVRAAHAALAVDPGVDLGLFTCDRPLLPFYTAAGWSELPGTVLVGGTAEDPFPSDRPGFDKVTMGDFFSPEAKSAAPAFRHTRIALHPGGVDRLW